MPFAFGAFLLGATLAIIGADPASATPQDYVFEAVQSKVQESANAIISVRLINKVSRKPVADAVILQTRLDMSPDDMGDRPPRLRRSRPASLGSTASRRI